MSKIQISKTDWIAYSIFYRKQGLNNSEVEMLADMHVV